jgi:putative peptide zinc metalloprotease protein
VVDDWSTWLKVRLSEEVADPESTVHLNEGVWESLKERLQITAYYPQANQDVIVNQISDRGKTYIVLKNPVQKTYIRLSESEFDIWSQMDGKTSVQDLIVENYMKTGEFARNKVLRIVEQLNRQYMLVNPPVYVWSQVSQAVQQRSWLSRLGAPAQKILTQQLSIKGLDGIIDKIYRYGGWLFYTKVAQVLFLIISILGFIAFSLLLLDPNYELFSGNIIGSMVTLWLVAIFPIMIHELGHALTVKHYGREVPRGGFMLFFGMPAAFVETTDIWLEPRKARLMVTWNGPYTGLIIGGIAAMIIYANPTWAFTPTLFKLVVISYTLVFINVNPLFKLDGYYLLSDAVDIPSLRERSMFFVRRKLWNKIVKREKFSREEIIFAVFGILSLIWSVYAIYLIYIIWKTRLESIFENIFGSSINLVYGFFGALLVLALISFLFLMTMKIYHLVRRWISRYTRSGGLARHGRLGLILMVLALIIGIGFPQLLPDYVDYIYTIFGILVVLLAIALIPKFVRPYLGSMRGLSIASFAGTLIVAGLSQIFYLIPEIGYLGQWLQAGALVLFIAGCLLLIWPPDLRLGYPPLVVGLLAGIILYVIVVITTSVSPVEVYLLLTCALAVAFVWCLFSLQGSARTPAVGLMGVGCLFLGISLIYDIQWINISYIGMMLIAAGMLHMVFARLPELSPYDRDKIFSQTGKAIGASVSIIVRRVITQIYFESGWRGVELLGNKFFERMKGQGVDISISENKFYDQELPVRTPDELTEIYGTVFDELHLLVCQELGDGMGTISFGYGIDFLPWQNREIMVDVIFSRLAWGASLTHNIQQVQSSYRALLKRVPLFITCTDDELDKVADYLTVERYSAGERIMNQGELGDKFYIVEHGIATVWQLGSDGVERQVDKKGPGEYFGEVGLVTHAPRNATVRAETPLALLSLSHEDFDLMVKQYVEIADGVNKKVKYGWLLRGMPIFDELESFEINLLAGRLQPETYQGSQVVFKQGEIGDKFYIVESGQLVVTREVDGKSVELSRRLTGDYLGEIALLQDGIRTATVTAVEDTTLLSLDAEYFFEMMSEFSGFDLTVTRTGTRRLSFIERADAISR